MKGFFTDHAPATPKNEKDTYQTGLSLLVRHPSMEIMRQYIFRGSVVWLVPSDKASDVEFFFVHSGKIEITVDGRTETFGPGDSFYARGLESELHFTTLEDTELIYASTAAVFEEEDYFQKDLQKMLHQINEKDNYTFTHSKRVMRYTMTLFRKMADRCENVTTNDLAVAALFHDIGKIRIPDEILKKKGRLDPDEYALMQQHSLYSAEILKTYFENSIADLALKHHERLDSSGYPSHFPADDIPFAARILAVADAFDAMTSDRGYNRVMTAGEAVAELITLPEKFDRDVVEMLDRLVRSGELTVDPVEAKS